MDRCLPLKPLHSILVKPAGPDCNLACGYCFYACKSEMFPEAKSHRMSEETLTVMLRQLMAQSGEEVGIGWQGGEPTLMGLGFFEKAVDLMGLSLDGPRHIHDRYRRTRDGKGAWETVVARAHLLLDAGVTVNALSVVTEDAADCPEEIYGFLKEQGLDHMQFIP